jgi:hypothetical protein
MQVFVLARVPRRILELEGDEAAMRREMAMHNLITGNIAEITALLGGKHDQTTTNVVGGGVAGGVRCGGGTG